LAHSLDRRSFIGTTVALGAAAFAAQAMADGGSASPASVLAVSNPDTLKLMAAVAAAAFDCEEKAAVCEQHCLEKLAAGDTAFAHCSTSVRQTQTLCRATGELATMKSVYTEGLLDVCARACDDCRAACEEHKAHWAHGMHLECKACAEACAALSDAVAALKAGWKLS
jgi:Cys-rich four helix bundle protein (predicted Tat secretion target)